MNQQRMAFYILATAAAAMLAASTIDGVPLAAVPFASPQEPAQSNSGATTPAGAVQYNHLVDVPADATWSGLFSANWR